MKCENCGCKYSVEDAIYDFESHFDGLVYRECIPNHLCSDCAIEYMENEINSQGQY